MTTPIYHEFLTRIRDTFPAPVSDRLYDAYFIFSIVRPRAGCVTSPVSISAPTCAARGRHLARPASHARAGNPLAGHESP